LEFGESKSIVFVTQRPQRFREDFIKNYERNGTDKTIGG
jgi:hypothetical protein